MTSDSDLPSFEHPPVVEVVCGVQFEPLTKFQTHHIGLLWEQYKPDYASCTENPPLASIIERFDDQPGMSIEIPNTLPMARTWFHHVDGTGIIQIQRDRFLHNWKMAQPEDAYPRYSAVIALFQEHLETFDEFLAEQGIGGIVPGQYEMTYVNHLLQGEGWESLEDLGAVFPDFFGRTGSRFLPTPDIFHWRTGFPLPDKSGRLHAAIRPANRKSDGKKLIAFELTARGFPVGDGAGTRDRMWEWFATAREWIVRGFADLAGSDIQTRFWGKSE